MTCIHARTRQRQNLAHEIEHGELILFIDEILAFN